MKEPLRPSTLGEILDRTAHLYRSRFLVFFGIAVVPTAVILVFASGAFLLLAWSGVNGTGFSGSSGIVAVLLVMVGLLVVLPVFLAVSALASAAMNHAVALANMGETTTIRDAYKAVWRRGWSYIGLYVLLGLTIAVAPFMAWFVLVFSSAALAAFAQAAGMGAAGGVLFGLAAFIVFFALVAYFFYMLLRLSLSFPSCVVEQIGAVAALKRSSNLTRGTKGRIFLLYLLGTVLGWMLTMVITVPLSFLTALIPGASSPEHASTVAMVLLFIIYGAGFAIQSLTRPVYGIALVLFYYDQRIRQEGFDIEWMMLQAGMVIPQAPPQPESTPWLPPITPKATFSDPQQSPSVAVQAAPTESPLSVPETISNTMAESVQAATQESTFEQRPVEQLIPDPPPSTSEV
jgi:uncharacterized membrane protein